MRVAVTGYAHGLQALLGQAIQRLAFAALQLDLGCLTGTTAALDETSYCRPV